MRNHHSIQFRSLIPRKYHCLSSYPPKMLIHIPHLGTRLKNCDMMERGCWQAMWHVHYLTAQTKNTAVQFRPIVSWWRCAVDRRWGMYIISLLKQRTLQCSSDHWSNTWQVTDSRIMGKWKWLFVNRSEYKGLISFMTEFLNQYQYGKAASVCLRNMMKNNDNFAE